MWLLLAIAAYVIFAASTITDKYLLGRPIPDARVYTFYTAVVGLFALGLAPFGFEIPQGIYIFLDVLAGMLFVAALFLFFMAVRIGEVSRVGTSAGGFVPFFTLLFVYIGTGELPSVMQFVAFVLVMAGSLIIVFERLHKIIENLFVCSLVMGSSVLFSLYFIAAKFLFFTQPFTSAFIWIKIGGALFALLFLLSPQVRKTIFAHKKLPLEKTKKFGGILIVKNAAGGLAALLLHAAISTARFGEIALIQALQGVQFTLVFFIALSLTKKFPKVIKEETHGAALAAKFLGTGLVATGVAVLALL